LALAEAFSIEPKTDYELLCEELRGTIEGFEACISRTELVFGSGTGDGESRGLAAYEHPAFNEDGAPDMDSDLWLSHESKSTVPSSFARAESFNRVNWVGRREGWHQQDVVSELCRIGLSTKTVNMLCEQLFGSYRRRSKHWSKRLPDGTVAKLVSWAEPHEFRKGYILDMVPMDWLLSRLFYAWDRMEETKGTRVPKFIVSRLYRLTEGRHDIKEAVDEEEQGGKEPGEGDDDARFFSPDPFHRHDWRDSVRSNGWDCFDYGLKTKRAQELALDSHRIVENGRILRDKMNRMPSVDTKLMAAREVLGKLRADKDAQGRRTLKFHEEHKLMGLALYLIHKVGANANYRLMDVCVLWSMDGRRFGMIPYGYGHGQWVRNACSEKYLAGIRARFGNAEANKIRDSYREHIEQARSHWKTMENFGKLLDTKLDDPAFVVKRESKISCGEHWHRQYWTDHPVKKEEPTPVYQHGGDVLEVVNDHTLGPLEMAEFLGIPKHVANLIEKQRSWEWEYVNGHVVTDTDSAFRCIADLAKVKGLRPKHIAQMRRVTMWTKRPQKPVPHPFRKAQVEPVDESLESANPVIDEWFVDGDLNDYDMEIQNG